MSLTHHLLPTAADETRYAFGRHVPHAAVKQVCTWMVTPASAPPKVRDAANLMQTSSDLLDVALAFTSLYDARHDADYNHLADFSRAATLSLIDQARDAIDKLNNAQGTPQLEAFFAHIALRSSV